ncbi:FAR1-related sequence 5-like protein [Tanacetum coccineum]
MDEKEVNKRNDLNKEEVTVKISCDTVVEDVADRDTVIEEVTAYFIDSPLYGLMRTTLRSESENSFFKSFTSLGETLVSFMMSYESAMERQRYRQESLDFKTIDAAPKCITQLDIELHAARVYTRTMFLIVQTELNEGSVVDGKVNVDTDGDGIRGSLQALIPLVGPALDRSLRLLRLQSTYVITSNSKRDSNK